MFLLYTELKHMKHELQHWLSVDLSFLALDIKHQSTSDFKTMCSNPSNLKKWYMAFEFIASNKAYRSQIKIKWMRNWLNGSDLNQQAHITFTRTHVLKEEQGTSIFTFSFSVSCWVQSKRQKITQIIWHSVSTVTSPNWLYISARFFTIRNKDVQQRWRKWFSGFPHISFIASKQYSIKSSKIAKPHRKQI